MKSHGVVGSTLGAWTTLALLACGADSPATTENRVPVVESTESTPEPEAEPEPESEAVAFEPRAEPDPSAEAESAAVVAAAAPEAAPTSEPAAALTRPVAVLRRGDVRWRLSIDPAVIRDGSARLTVSVENLGEAVYEPVRPTSYQLDGAPSMGLGLRFGNGVTGPEWRRLPSGRRAELTREVGSLLTPGEHVIAVQIVGGGWLRVRARVR